MSFPPWLLPFLCGLLVGAVLANKDFRKRFFTSVKSFLSKANKGAQEQNRRTEEELRKAHDGLYGKRTQPSKRPPKQEGHKPDDRDWW